LEGGSVAFIIAAVVGLLHFFADLISRKPRKTGLIE